MTEKIETGQIEVKSTEPVAGNEEIKKISPEEKKLAQEFIDNVNSLFLTIKLNSKAMLDKQVASDLGNKNPEEWKTGFPRIFQETKDLLEQIKKDPTVAQDNFAKILSNINAITTRLDRKFIGGPSKELKQSLVEAMEKLKAFIYSSAIKNKADGAKTTMHIMSAEENIKKFAK